MAFRRRLIAFTGTGLLTAALGTPAADAAEPGSWYIGGSTDNTHVEVYRGLGWEPGGEERGVSIRGGWQFSPHFALEIGALRASDLRWTEYFSSIDGYLTSHTTFDTTALQVSAIGSMHWGSIFEGYVKAGLAQYRVDGRQVLDTLLTDAALTRDVSASGIDYLLGAGLAMKASPRWRVRIEYQYFGLDRDFLGVRGGDDPSIDTFAIGIDYQLPRRKATVNALR
jgi:opacity protein-like surface antigen